MVIPPSLASLEQPVIDDDIDERILRMCVVTDSNSDTLALALIAAVGPNRHFLAEPHTLKYLRREFCPSKLATRLHPEAWMEAGAKYSPELAANRLKVILKDTPEPGLEPRVLSELSCIVALAEEEKNNPS